MNILTKEEAADRSASANSTSEPPESVQDLTERNIRLIAEMEAAAHSKRTISDKIVDAITGFCGRMAFVYVHLAFFGMWIALNITHVVTIDPYPFNLLALIAGLEAIFLATFILISQNRQARIAERRSHLDLQINLLSEQENTKMLTMLQAIQANLGIDDCAPDVKILMESAEPDVMIRQIETIMESDS